MKHKYVEMIANEFILDRDEELISQELICVIRKMKNKSVVVVRDASDPYGSRPDRMHGFTTDSFNDSINLLENIGYKIVGTSIFLEGLPKIEENKSEPIELEAKVEVSKKELERIQNYLREQGRDQAYFTEENYLFDKEENPLDEGSMLRIRMEKGYFLKDKKKLVKNYWLTYKGAMEDSELNKRLEINLKINTYSGAYHFLSMMGYKILGGYHKQRKVYDLGDTKVFLDKACKCPKVFVDRIMLGDRVLVDPVDTWRTFVEVEGPNEKSIKDTLEKELRLEKYRNINLPYLDIL